MQLANPGFDTYLTSFSRSKANTAVEVYLLQSVLKEWKIYIIVA